MVWEEAGEDSAIVTSPTALSLVELASSVQYLQIYGSSLIEAFSGMSRKGKRHFEVEVDSG